MNKIQLEPKQLSIVKEILKEHEIIAFVFGSRSKNTAKKLSDLDLCLKENYNKSAVRSLQDAFEDSDLPFKVDIVVWSELSDGFKSQIENDLVRFD